MPRVKAHLKVHLSVADHHRTAEAWADLELRGMLVELWRLAFSKYAPKRADWVPLRPFDRMQIACVADAERADERVRRLCEAVGYEVRTYPNRWEVRVRNCAKRNGIAPQESTDIPVPTSDQNLCQNTEYRVQRADTESREQKGRRSRKRSTPHPCPDQLTDEERDRIADWAAKQDPPIAREHLGRAWEVFRTWAHGDEVQKRSWPQAFRNALLRGWVLKQSANGPSRAQARQDATRDAAQGAMDLHRQRRKPRAVAPGGLRRERL